MSLDVRFHFRKISKLLAAEADVAGGTGHAVTTGKLRELIVHKFLRPNLPKRLDIRSGVIIDSLGNRSRQQDCIIVEADFPTVSVGSELDAVILAESVIATIEIKSYLSSDELRKTLESVALTKRLHRNGEQLYKKGGMEIKPSKPHPILTYIFAFDGAELGTLHSEVARYSFQENDGGIAPEATCVLSKGTMIRAPIMPTVDMSRHEVKLPSVKGVEFSYHALVKDALFAFYSRFKDDVLPLQMIHYNIDPYYSLHDLE